MSSLNKVMLIGRCAAKPDSKVTGNGKCRARMRLATDRYWRDDDGDHKATEWHTVIAWDRLAENCAEYLDKGRLVFVEGRLQSRSWKDDEGTEKTVREVIANRVSFLTSAKSAEGTASAVHERD